MGSSVSALKREVDDAYARHGSQSATPPNEDGLEPRSRSATPLGHSHLVLNENVYHDIVRFPFVRT